MLRRVISGGQTGVDIAALRAAKAAGFETGGYIPRGFRTEAGDRPEYADLYGLVETASREYPERTRRNVEAADLTLVITTTLTSPGTRLVAKLARELGRRLTILDTSTWGETPAAFLSRPDLHAAWVNILSGPDVEAVEVLNVAGNRDPKLEEPVGDWLLGVFTAVKERQTLRTA